MQQTTNEDDSVTVSIKGKLYPKETLLFRQAVGTAEDSDSGNKYEMSLVNMTKTPQLLLTSHWVALLFSMACP